MNRIPILPVLLASALTASGAAAQTACSLAPGAPPNYVATPIAPAFASISGAIGEVVLFVPVTDDTTSAATPLPAPFSFYGVPKATFQVNNNGWIAFDQALGLGYFTNAAIPTAAAPNDVIFPWWDDNYLFAGGGGSVSYLVTGGGDLIVQWTGEGHFGTTAGTHSATFQAILHPSPLDTIDLVYDGASFVAGPSWTATIGVENATGTLGLDVTGGGTTNAVLPATDYSLAFGPPGPPTPVLNYVATPMAPAFSSISGAIGEVVLFVPITDDTTSAATPLPAPFSFYGAPKATFQVNNNGWIAFDQALGAGYFTNAAIPTAAAPNDVIFPWWDDNYLFTGVGSVSYLVTGGGDLIVQWTSEGHFATTAGTHSATYQAILHPSPADTIEFHYDAASFVAGPSWTATIGVENATGTVGLDVTGLGTLNTVLPATDYLLDLCVPCGTTASFGPPCPSTIGTAGGPPLAGNLGFMITQAGAAPSVPSFLVLGFSNTAWVLPPAIPLPLPLFVFGAVGGCSLLVSADIILSTATTPGGTSAVPIPIPPGTTPCIGVYFQWVNVTGIFPLTLPASDGMLVATG